MSSKGISLGSGLFGLAVLSLLGSFYYQNSATPEFAMTLGIGSAFLFGVSWLIQSNSHKNHLSKLDTDEQFKSVWEEFGRSSDDYNRKFDDVERNVDDRVAEVWRSIHKLEDTCCDKNSCRSKVCKKEILNEG